MHLARMRLERPSQSVFHTVSSVPHIGVWTVRPVRKKGQTMYFDCPYILFLSRKAGKNKLSNCAPTAEADQIFRNLRRMK